jgi:hypothetical protein
MVAGFVVTAVLSLVTGVVMQRNTRPALGPKWYLTFVGVPGTIGGRLTTRRLHGKKLAVADRNEAGCERGIRGHQGDERRHFFHVRRRIIDD